MISGFTTMGACLERFGGGFSGGYAAIGFALLGICAAAFLGIAGIVCAVISNNRHEPGKLADHGILLSLAFVPIIIGIMCLSGLFEYLGWMD